MNSNNGEPQRLATEGNPHETNSPPFTLRAADGFELAATWYAPPVPPRAAVVIAPATGVPRRFYDRFARYLVETGDAAVLTFDYRGIGDSRPRSLRGFTAQMRQWGTHDLSAAIEEAGRRAPGVPRNLVAHSVGGQIFGLAHNADEVQTVLGVAAQHGHWRNWPLRQQPRLLLLWYVLFPTLTPALGYFPSRRFGLGENLPHGVALEWARWCRARDYLRDVVEPESCRGYDEFRGRLRAYSIADDFFAPSAAVERLLTWYPKAETSLVHVAPADVGASAIGHFGFFRDTFRDTLWRDARDWLLPQALLMRSNSPTHQSDAT